MAQTLETFSRNAATNPQFNLSSDGSWTYTCQGEGVNDLMVDFGFLDIGGVFIPKLHGMTKFGTIYVASLADLVSMIMKAPVYQNRDEWKDFQDMVLALNMMKERGETFQGYRFKKSEINVILEVVEITGDDAVKELFRQVM